MATECDISQYFQALQREFEWYLHHNLFSEYKPETVYVGGGTPSLTTEELLTFFQYHREVLSPELFCEATIEVNPGTISFSQFQQLRQEGFNRVSIGVQSCDDEELKRLGRIHSSAEALTCFDAARRAGFRNISLDLMFGIPESNLKTWEHSLNTAISLKPEHISVYNLTIEEGTPFWTQGQQGELNLPEEVLQLEMYRTAIETLIRAGYEQYEISNFALPGYRCQHNQIYWRNEEYLGLGAGAHSYLKGSRYWNYADLGTYVASYLDGRHLEGEAHREGCLDGRHLEGEAHREDRATSGIFPPAVEGEEHLEPLATMGETIVMNLRMLEGLDLAAFQQRFGYVLESLYAESIENLRALKLIEIRNQHLRLTRRGIELSNEVFQEFIR